MYHSFKANDWLTFITDVNLLRAAGVIPAVGAVVDTNGQLGLPHLDIGPSRPATGGQVNAHLLTHSEQNMDVDLPAAGPVYGHLQSSNASGIEEQNMDVDLPPTGPVYGHLQPPYAVGIEGQNMDVDLLANTSGIPPGSSIDLPAQTVWLGDNIFACDLSLDQHQVIDGPGFIETQESLATCRTQVSVSEDSGGKYYIRY